MKKYKFFETYGKNIVGSSKGYFNILQDLPAEFSLNEIKATNFLSASKLKRLEKARDGTIIEICKLAGWSSKTGTAIYLAIKCLGESQLNIDGMRTEKSIIENRLKVINDEINKLAASLVTEKDLLQKRLKELNEYIKRFNSGENS